jgi:hypothetical protein
MEVSDKKSLLLVDYTAPVSAAFSYAIRAPAGVDYSTGLTRPGPSRRRSRWPRLIPIGEPLRRQFNSRENQ